MRQDIERVSKNGGEETGWVAEADDGDLMGGEALDNVVDGDVGGAADEDALVAADKLKDELDEGVSFASLTACQYEGAASWWMLSPRSDHLHPEGHG